jgi:hypothetical protein
VSPLGVIVGLIFWAAYVAAVILFFHGANSTPPRGPHGKDHNHD